jgi:adenine phosphoribosyltransferase
MSYLLNRGHDFSLAINTISKKVSRETTIIAGVETRGIILAAPVAYLQSNGFVAIRKPSKTPGKVLRKKYIRNHKPALLELQDGLLTKYDTVTLVDDMLETGDTAKAAIELIRETGATISKAVFLIEMMTSNGGIKLQEIGVEVDSIVRYYKI